MKYLLIFTVGFLSSCQALKTTFQSGAWFGILIIIGLFGVILFMVTRNKKNITVREEAEDLVESFGLGYNFWGASECAHIAVVEIIHALDGILDVEILKRQRRYINIKKEIEDAIA